MQYFSVLCSFRPRSFCELTTRFSLDVSDYHEEKHYFPLLMSVVVVTLCSTVLLYISFKHYTKKTLTRHMESEAHHHRLQELKYVILFTHTVICTIESDVPGCVSIPVLASGVFFSPVC